MAAPLYPSFQSPRRPSSPVEPMRLRVIEGGQSDAAIERRRLYRRRRIVVALLAVVAVVSCVRVAQVVGEAVGADGPATLTVGVAGEGAAAAVPEVPTAPIDAEPVAAPLREYVVRRGDTLWSIAASLGGDADVRELVDELSRRVQGGALQPGQRIDLEGLPGLDG